MTKENNIKESNEHMIVAPWPLEIVKKLNDYQWSMNFHPYTCLDSWHRPLVASRDGWFCLDCSYTQNWFWKGTLDG